MALIICSLVLTSCIPGDGANNPNNIAGFFTGVWHGWMALISLAISFFKDGINIYEVYNNGFMYNLGYYMAIISGFWGLGFTRKNKKDK